MSTPSLSLQSVQEELDQLRKDREAFGQAYELVRQRLQGSLNSTRSYPPLHKWSGSRAVCGSLEMAIARIEQNIEEHSNAILSIRDGTIEDSDAATGVRLGVIQGGDDER